MKNFFQKDNLWITVLCAISLFFGACDQPTNSSQTNRPPPDNQIGSVNKFQAHSSAEKGEKKIKYSYTYDGYDFYYIHLGELKNTPMFFIAPEYHNGMNWAYTFSTEEITEKTIRDRVDYTIQEVKGLLEEHTLATETGKKISNEVSVKATVDILEVGRKTKAETDWRKYVSDTIANTREYTTSLINSEEHAVTHTQKTMLTRSWNFTSQDKNDITN